jgi:hypothetical protein
MPETDHEAFEEKHFTPSELAKLWGVSPDTIRRIFAAEVGTLVLRSPSKRKHARSYKTLRIPASVAARVYQKNCTVARIVDHRKNSREQINNTGEIRPQPSNVGRSPESLALRTEP